MFVMSKYNLILFCFQKWEVLTCIVEVWLLQEVGTTVQTMICPIGRSRQSEGYIIEAQCSKFISGGKEEMLNGTSFKLEEHLEGLKFWNFDVYGLWHPVSMDGYLFIVSVCPQDGTQPRRKRGRPTAGPPLPTSHIKYQNTLQQGFSDSVIMRPPKIICTLTRPPLPPVSTKGWSVTYQVVRWQKELK
jgi:hypothetical protein